ncbi:MAG TPA: Hsp70 family protein, partial [Terriglobia bacterium]|nr:Hsp70 family protein [Terriglobia bacterium]
VLGGEVKDLLLLDVTPLTLGVETLGSVMTPLIQRNTTIPTRKTETFSTAADNQTSVEIHVLQGERPGAKDNRTLGKFHLVGIPPAMRGIPQIEVTFDIDANGILNVAAKDLGTNREQKITITSSSGLSKDEVERMKQEAEAHSDEDRQYKEQVEVKNRADSLVYSVEKTLKENRDKVSEEDAKGIEAAVDEAKKAIQEGNVEAINATVERLTQASHKLAEAMYKRQAGTAAPTPSEGEGGAGQASTAGSNSEEKAKGEGEVIDAEVVDGEDKNKK